MGELEFHQALSAEPTRPLRRAEYEHLVAGGAFEDERVELLEGVIVAMSPQDPQHAGVIQFLGRAFERGVGDRAAIRTQMPLAISDKSLPEPDLAVVAPGGYRSSHPTTAMLVVEVAGNSVRKDRQIKGELYARAAIPEYWIINLQSHIVEVHTDPTAGSYGRITPVRVGETLRPQAFPDLEISVGDLLGVG